MVSLAIRGRVDSRREGSTRFGYFCPGMFLYREKKNVFRAMRYMSALNGPSLSLLATLLWVCDLQQIIFHTMASQLCGKERWFNFAISNWAREKSEVNGTGRLSAMMIRTHGVWSSAWKRSGREDRNWARKWVGYRSSTNDEKKSGWQKKKGLLLPPPPLSIS
jgi:hypothetical protein